MTTLNHHEMTALFLALGVLLFAARTLGEIARRFHQPAILGEIIAGIILGPTVLGHLAPGFQQMLFPSSGPSAVVLNSFMGIAITLFLLVAGIEVDLSSVFKQGKAAVFISLGGLIIPFILGFGAVILFPQLWNAPVMDGIIFPLFLGTALAITALPVIAKIMMDLNLYRTDLGMTVIAAAVMNDLVGWIFFAFIMGLMGTTNHGQINFQHIMLLTAGFVVGILVVGRWLLDRILPWLQAHTSWPGGIIGFSLAAALLCAAFTEGIGIHALFGAFLFGVALGDSRHLRERTRNTIDQFTSFFFAPLFFAGIGLKVDFVRYFDPMLVAVVVLLGKLLGCGLSARLSGFSLRESLAVGFGMNARGAMEIILGLLALQAGLIDERIFVALVVMALITSMTSGSLMQFLMRQQKEIHFYNYLNAKSFAGILQSKDRYEAIVELAGICAPLTGLNAFNIAEDVWEREQMMSTGLEAGLAIPHARIKGLTSPVIGVGISNKGIDFDAPDGSVSNVIIIILTPEQDHQIQLDLLADIVKTFTHVELIERCAGARSYTEFLALLKSLGK